MNYILKIFKISLYVGKSLLIFYVASWLVSLELYPGVPSITVNTVYIKT